MGLFIFQALEKSLVLTFSTLQKKHYVCFLVAKISSTQHCFYFFLHILSVALSVVLKTFRAQLHRVLSVVLKSRDEFG